MEDIVWVEREKKENMYDATKPIPGTKSYFQFRGTGGCEEVIAKGKKRIAYPVYTSHIPCACDVCLAGGFDHCQYLEKRGGVTKHLMEEKKGGEGVRRG